MNKDILRTAIENTAKKYVKEYVKVNVYKTEPYVYWHEYTLQLNYNNCHTLYKLHNKYVKSEHYIMRVVSDLCINLADMTQQERNYFFKRSDN